MHTAHYAHHAQCPRCSHRASATEQCALPCMRRATAQQGATAAAACRKLRRSSGRRWRPRRRRGRRARPRCGKRWTRRGSGARRRCACSTRASRSSRWEFRGDGSRSRGTCGRARRRRFCSWLRCACRLDALCPCGPYVGACWMGTSAVARMSAMWVLGTVRSPSLISGLLQTLHRQRHLGSLLRTGIRCY